MHVYVMYVGVYMCVCVRVCVRVYMRACAVHVSCLFSFPCGTLPGAPRRLCLGCLCTLHGLVQCHKQVICSRWQFLGSPACPCVAGQGWLGFWISCRSPERLQGPQRANAGLGSELGAQPQDPTATGEWWPCHRAGTPTSARPWNSPLPEGEQVSWCYGQLSTSPASLPGVQPCA